MQNDTILLVGYSESSGVVLSKSKETADEFQHIPWNQGSVARQFRSFYI